MYSLKNLSNENRQVNLFKIINDIFVRIEEFIQNDSAFLKIFGYKFVN